MSALNHVLKPAALLALFVAASLPARAQHPQEPAFEAVAPLLKTHCVACHSGDKPNGELNLANLAPDFAANQTAWKSVFERMNEGSMPPKGKPQPSAAERKTILSWVESGLADHQRAQAAALGRTRHRRLNRIEYANTIRDLLGADVDIETLPEDGVAGGFDNVDAALDLSSTLLERYLETADTALDPVFVEGPPPERKKQYFDFNDTPYPEPGLATIRRATQTRVAGLYRFRFETQAINSAGGLTLLVYVGNYGAKSPANRLVGGFDVHDRRTPIVVAIPMAAGESLRVFPFETVKHYGKIPQKVAEPGLVVHGVEVDGPIHDVWPPLPTTRLLGNQVDARATRADAEATRTQAKAIFRKFAPRAFRRPVTDEELTPFFDLLNSRFDQGYDFTSALRVALKAVLCSPDFLYLSAPPGKLNDFDLASRLSYFLWSSTPDDKLSELAARGELGRSDVLREQVERMLGDPKASAFTKNFTGQWLSLRHLQATTPDKNLYPDFDDLLEVSMPRETHLFFEEILKHDRSALEFLHSDWSMLNERLAFHYGIPGVEGNDFRKVMLPADRHRGGVLTQAAILKVTANGTNTSPVVRGAWVLGRILGTPPPRPPKDVPAIEPDVRGAVTIRQQLAKHKQIESCASCHAKIDPPGNALENFDVIGGWRETYRTSRAGPRKMIPTGRGRTTWMHFGAKIEAADELEGGRAFADVDGFKKLLLENPDQFARGLTEKLMVYATGHELEFADRPVIDRIVAEAAPKRFGFRALIHAVVQSETFRNK
jgi:mono/diheme cytochrome c family protein